MPPADAERRLAAILSADVAGYSRLMADDEDATVRALRATREQVAALITEHRGRLADFTGDNFLAEFAAARDAVECALAIGRVVEARNASVPEPRRMRFRIGAHLGDVRHEDGRLFGDGVNIAARLQPLAEPGGLCISSTLADVVRGKLAIALEDMGEQTLKNIPEPVRAFRVRAVAEGAQPLAAPAAPRPRWRWLAPTAAALALAAIAGFTYFARDRAPDPTAEPVTTAAPAASDLGPIRSIAVLPLTNLSGDPEQEFFADGMTETLIAELSKLPGVRVISRTSVMQFKGTKTALPEIAKTLNVDGVIEGSVMRAGNEVRITAQLIDARADRHLWAQQYDRELARVLEIQSEVARAVAAEIELALSPQQTARLAQRLTVDPRAPDAYFRGLAHRVVFAPGGIARSVAALEEAVAVAPNYAPAHASLAASLIMLVWTGASPLEMLPRVKQAAVRAVALDDGLGDAHMALGVALYRWDWDYTAAEREIRRGRALGASDPVICALASDLFFATGRTAEALSWVDEVARWAPLDLFVRTQRAQLLNASGRPQEALAEADRILAIDPRYGGGGFQRAAALEQLGRFDEVIRDMRQTQKLFPEVGIRPERAERALRTGGPAGYWRNKARFHLADTTYQTFRDPVAAALALAQIGAFDEAFAALELAYEQRMLEQTLFADERSLPLRWDPRFAELARRMNLALPRQPAPSHAP